MTDDELISVSYCSEHGYVGCGTEVRYVKREVAEQMGLKPVLVFKIEPEVEK